MTTPTLSPADPPAPKPEPPQKPKPRRKGCCLGAIITALLLAFTLPPLSYWSLYRSVIRDPIFETGREGPMADDEAYTFFSLAALIDHGRSEKKSLRYLRGRWEQSEITLVGSEDLSGGPETDHWMEIGNWGKREKPHRHWTTLELSVPKDRLASGDFFYPSIPLLDPESDKSHREQISNRLLSRDRRPLPGYFASIAVRPEDDIPYTTPEGKEGMIIPALIFRPWPKGTPFPYGKETVHVRSNNYTVDDPAPADVDRLVVYSVDAVLAWKSVQNELHWALVFERAE
ncbi:MAG: hypothetical protein AAF733_07495 [Verrucomicrobiota bacterium]